MRHWLVGDWAIEPGDMHLINCSRVYSYIEFMDYEPEFISIDKISYKEMRDDYNTMIRLDLANVNEPGILVKDMINPHNKEYRLIDGRHRIHKNILSGSKFFKAYVITKEEVLNFIQDGSHYYETHAKL